MSERASDYLATELPPWRRLTLRMHLWVCGRCRRYVAQMAAVVAALGGLDEALGGDDEDPVLSSEMRAELSRRREHHRV